MEIPKLKKQIDLNTNFYYVQKSISMAIAMSPEPLGNKTVFILALSSCFK